ncbi:hypothetical protein AB0H49_29000 [Nocardia sp. NPDC050713]|uniref:hypothetical protein n=1 Tax=Nocardia sp. NPDC050713 TaxID=3154511 RepID=UPI00340CB6E5
MTASWWALRVLVVGVIAAVSLAGTGCGSIIDRAAAPDVETSTSPELVQEALEFGGWVIPAGGKILLVERRIVRNRKYLIALQTSPSDLDWMLEKSGFEASFEKAYPPFLAETIAGPDLMSSPNVRSARDTLVSSPGKGTIRQVAVDDRSQDIRIVHLEFRRV